MKIAIFHNCIDNIGGAEIVTLTLARELNADIYTTNIDYDKVRKMGFSDISSKIFSIGKIPKMAPFRQQLALWKFRRLNLRKKYNFYVISGDWAMSGAVNHHPNMWYVHSPLNEIWKFKNHIKKEMMMLWKHPIYELWVIMNRFLTTHYSKKVDSWICNSKNTQSNIKKYYNKEAVIIYPPVDIKKYYFNKDKNYWLSVNRLTSNKKIEIQIEAFKKLPNEKLIVVGSYEKDTKQFEKYRNYLESIKPENVKIIHWINDEELKKLYSECIGLITTSRDEDFGMNVVEALASGKPVIAPNQGGYVESIVNIENGILIDKIDENKLVETINKIKSELAINKNKYRENCQKRARLYCIENFIQKIKDQIKNV